VQSVWPVWSGFGLLGTARYSLFGLFGLGLTCLVQSALFVWSGLICLVLLGTAWYSVFGLFGLV
jgi:hypothetical protein